jgi:hypothetical protein
MEEYIMTHESRDTVRVVLDEFYEMQLIARAHSQAFRYPTIKRWFLQRYPEFLEYGMKKNAEDQKVNVLKIPNDSAAADIKKGA